jgi:LysR family nitrogen assimilation transcriptional regulator
LSTALSRSIAGSERVELRELRYFATVARSGNFGRAAQELKISQPTLSHQIRKLEEELGTQLLVRHARGVTLTPSGTCLLERLDTIMHLLAAPLEHETAQAVRGTVSIAMPAEIAPLLAPALVEAFHASWPRVALDIKEATSGTLDAWVLNGRVDIAVLQDPPELDELQTEPLLTENLGLVAAPRSRIAESDAPVHLRELVDLPLILPRAQHWIWRRLTSAAFRRGVRIEPAFQADSLALAKEMVRTGLGCTVLPRAAIRDELARGTLVFRPIEQPSLSATHAIAFRRTTTEPLVRGFASLIRDVMKTLATDGTWIGARIVRTEIAPDDAAATEQPDAWQAPAGERLDCEPEPVGD